MPVKILSSVSRYYCTYMDREIQKLRFMTNVRKTLFVEHNDN